MCYRGMGFIPALTTTVRTTGCPKAFQYSCILYVTKNVSVEMLSGVFPLHTKEKNQNKIHHTCRTYKEIFIFLNRGHWYPRCCLVRFEITLL
jgi:hypothetical protein